MDLKELRGRIDAIDDDLSRLFAERMTTVAAIAEYKRVNGAVIRDRAREREILDRVAAGVDPACAPYVKDLYRQIFELSRIYEASLLGHRTPLTERPEAASPDGLKARMPNLVLIGMAGCGKTTLGELAAKAMRREFVSSDDEVEHRAGMPIPRIFSEKGEAAFREIEHEVIADLARGSGIVIATGGGAILRDDNVRALRENGRLCLITRAIDRLAKDGRPLSQVSGNAVADLWAARKERYYAAADYIVGNDEDIETAVKAVVAGFREAVRH